MKDLKTILIVDDNLINREILTGILSKDYKILEAENGENALKLLESHSRDIAAIILDLIMPIMDGYEVLTKLYANSLYENMPTIVTTGHSEKESEKRALHLGAWDFISKPYDADIIKFRLKNVISRSQLAAFERLKYLTEYDTLTGIYNKTKFFQATREMLDNNPNERFLFVRFDIDRFQLINSFFGHLEGDRLLKFIAKLLGISLIKHFLKYTYGRMESDIFCFCIPFDENKIHPFMEKSKLTFAEYNKNYDIVPSFGLYIIENPSLSIETIYSRAELAAKKCKGSYMQCYAYYDEKIALALAFEQKIANEMNHALMNEEFEIYLQPKYNLTTKMPAGAEALVRWNHPQEGMISPGKFIPVFERNGFIAKLDFFVWEKVCQLLHQWMQEGKTLYPISVNVSRVNIYNPKFVEQIINLVNKYKIPPALFNLELTESVYTDDSALMNETMTRLQEKGFVIMMDDFGSGYSSLNILKDINVDILKIDMRFLSKAKLPGRSENIIASVIRMAKWLNMPVIAEGVEIEEQVNFLHSIGCEFVQGFYFAKPMPIVEYEALINGMQSFVSSNKFQPKFDANALWASNSQMEELFGNLMQATVIFEFDDNCIELLRVNNAYYNLLGYDGSALKLKNPIEIIQPDYREKVIETFNQAVSTQETSECEYLRYGISPENNRWIKMRLKYMNCITGKHLLIGTIADISEQKEIDHELQKYRAAISLQDSCENTILIVDDIAVDRAILAAIFKNKYKILEAENGQEAIDILEKNPQKIQLILLDLMMPIMDGREFLKRKKMNARLAMIPVIAITSDDRPEQQIQTLSQGVNDYIVKPFIRESVMRRVDNVLAYSKRFEEVLKTDE